ncbi:EVE domain-containing protein [Rhodococcoides corynebacterioides]|uniref:EVE domain-containing protein n=1 Tax=Rhodococcoides corynebacterioides TaxID=53972 RepID=A0ABS7P2S1_9NOCA|nr:EVE domain-containing protein [Rhodococcus corynebacterioides]MBY6366605.1 EVE domain-containing protein [Rhodococcus corynebacterioides]MBY6408668.1 EVE domain-containing protein [Rhodococcus corynebacterioides]
MATVSRADLGAWVITVNPRLTDVAAMIAAGDLGGEWCIAPNYRTALMEPGDAVVLWVTAGGGRGPGRGVHGVGEVTGSPHDRTDPADRRWHVPTRIAVPARTVTAEECRATSDLARMEVLRSPQQANPSYLTRREWAALVPLMGR